MSDCKMGHVDEKVGAVNENRGVFWVEERLIENHVDVWEVVKENENHGDGEEEATWRCLYDEGEKATDDGEGKGDRDPLLVLDLDHDPKLPGEVALHILCAF